MKMTRTTSLDGEHFQPWSGSAFNFTRLTLNKSRFGLPKIRGDRFTLRTDGFLRRSPGRYRGRTLYATRNRLPGQHQAVSLGRFVLGTVCTPSRGSGGPLARAAATDGVRTCGGGAP